MSQVFSGSVKTSRPAERGKRNRAAAKRSHCGAVLGGLRRSFAAVNGIVCLLLGVALFVLSAGSAVRGASALQASPAQVSSSSSVPAQRALVTRYCVTCHNKRVKTAGLMLDKMDLDRVPEGSET